MTARNARSTNLTSYLVNRDRNEERPNICRANQKINYFTITKTVSASENKLKFLNFATNKV